MSTRTPHWSLTPCAVQAAEVHKKLLVIYEKLHQPEQPLVGQALLNTGGGSR